MSENLIRAHDNRNHPIITSDHPWLDLTYFNLVQLDQGQAWSGEVAGFELLAVVLSGSCDIQAGDVEFEGVGSRPDIWSGPADSVYAGTGATVTVRARKDGTEVALAGGKCDLALAPFRIPPEEVQMVDVGSPETHSRRRIFHILGSHHQGQAGHLLVSELYADPGCWSGYPPHKHDTERPPEETAFEEVYHYRFAPKTGFGGQYLYDEAGHGTVFMTRHGDTMVVDKGYHPTVTSPGHREYIFTILVGRHQRSLVQYFHPDQQWLMNEIPGIGAMRAKFK